MYDRSIILLFIKAPVKGQVKSRLAAAIGDDTALELYKNFILDSITTVKETGHPFRIIFYPPDAANAVTAWLGSGSCMPQFGNNLGERMEHAFSRVFSEGWRNAVLIGSDIPDLPSGVINESLGALEMNDAVIGPASDGGYYLIGFKNSTFLPSTFHKIPWGTDAVFRDTMKILTGSSLKVYLAPEQQDIDTLEDLRSLFERDPHPSFDKSRTMTYLRMNRHRLP